MHKPQLPISIPSRKRSAEQEYSPFAQLVEQHKSISNRSSINGEFDKIRALLEQSTPDMSTWRSGRVLGKGANGSVRELIHKDMPECKLAWKRCTGSRNVIQNALREVDIYRQKLKYHPNIIQFIGHDTQTISQNVAATPPTPRYLADMQKMPNPFFYMPGGPRMSVAFPSSFRLPSSSSDSSGNSPLPSPTSWSKYLSSSPPQQHSPRSTGGVVGKLSRQNTDSNGLFFNGQPGSPHSKSPPQCQITPRGDNISSVNIYLELCEGGSLADLLNTAARYDICRWPESVARFYANQLVRAVRFLHTECGLIHRDLKPENCVLETDSLQRIKLVDVATAIEIDNAQNQPPNQLVGTCWYVPPEALREARYGTFTDVWGIGCIVFRMLCGQKPWCVELQSKKHENDTAILISINQLLTKGRTTDMLPQIPPCARDSLSSNAIYFLRACLELDAKSRTTVEDLLYHPWLLHQETEAETKERTEFLLTLGNYRRACTSVESSPMIARQNSCIRDQQVLPSLVNISRQLCEPSMNPLSTEDNEEDGSSYESYVSSEDEDESIEPVDGVQTPASGGETNLTTLQMPGLQLPGACSLALNSGSGINKLKAHSPMQDAITNGMAKRPASPTHKKSIAMRALAFLGDLRKHVHHKQTSKEGGRKPLKDATPQRMSW